VCATIVVVPTIAYHVSSSRNRESIQRHGLDWKRMQGQRGVAGSDGPERAGVFLASDLWTAEWFVQMSRTKHQSVDIWEVTLPHDVDLDAEEPPAGLPYGVMDGFMHTTEPVPPDRVRLLRADAQLPDD
jgi:hypothetical protein